MSDGPRHLPPKKEVALALLEQSSLFIHLDPRREGVVVPKWLAGSPQLVLQVGLNMAVQIPDLTVDDDGICCTLSFNRSPVWCNMPWHAVFALRDEEGRRMVWPEDIPPELLQPAGAASAAPAPTPGRPALSLVKPVELVEPEEAPKPAAKRKPRKPKVASVETTEEAKAEAPAEAPPAAKKRRTTKPKAAPAEETEAAPAKAKRVRPKAAKPVALVAVAPPPALELATVEASEPEAGSSMSASTKKPKRELPPYLRVVK